MLRGVFSARSLTRVIRAGDSQRFGIDLRANGPTIVDGTVAAALDRTIDLDNFFRARVKRKPCVSYPQYQTNLVLRAIAAFLTQRFRVVAPNRDRIVQGVVEALMDTTPMHVVRRDVTSFYETIPVQKLRDRLIFDTALPRAVRHYLRLFFDRHSPTAAEGLPRGVGLTAVLVELAMEEFDRSVRAIPGVYRYFRYSDDILVFAYENPSRVETALDDLLPSEMSYNISKSQTVAFTHKGKPPRADKVLEYLGYEFSVPDKIGGADPRTVRVSIAEKKIARLKSRLIVSLKSFQRTGNTRLLIDRLELLTSNHQVHKRGMSFYRDTSFIKTGIFYNYRRCGLYEKGKFREHTPEKLLSLDSMMHTLLKSPRSSFSAAVAPHLAGPLRERFAKLSFRRGFESRILIKMPYLRLSEVKSAWRNV